MSLKVVARYTYKDSRAEKRRKEGERRGEKREDRREEGEGEGRSVIAEIGYKGTLLELLLIISDLHCVKSACRPLSAQTFVWEENGEWVPPTRQTTLTLHHNEVTTR